MLYYLTDFNQGGDMKKVFVVPLLLVGIFLIGNAEAVFLGNCPCYQCNLKTLCPNGDSLEFPESVRLCMDEGSATIEGQCLGCFLGGKSLFSSNKNFIGSGSSCWGHNSGCSAILRGRLMTIDLYDEFGCMTQLRCVQGGVCIDN
jgi:hypothetical protein